jgi:hypothetical protein
MWVGIWGDGSSRWYGREERGQNKAQDGRGRAREARAGRERERERRSRASGRHRDAVCGTAVGSDAEKTRVVKSSGTRGVCGYTLRCEVGVLRRCPARCGGERAAGNARGSCCEMEVGRDGCGSAKKPRSGRGRVGGRGHGRRCGHTARIPRGCKTG